jgi:hypothetical protein
MLSRVLLHVVAAAFAHRYCRARSARQRQLHRRFQVVDDPAIFRIRNFRDAQPIVAVRSP